MLGGDFNLVDYMVWNEIPTVLGNLVGGLTFVGLTLFATHARTGPDRLTVPDAPVVGPRREGGQRMTPIMAKSEAAELIVAAGSARS
ncbi:hypothetical protein MDUV_00020 [Mycolicibacterium duvalii]|uniref:Formate transporter n=1 Tax=Mycolicibacterium duvalii TaxID=39688 RepID=A0A7I7JVM2_9MYCO|nr:hypothetical protein MDUV_00020 [Mycolicibacterium duvalii]